jgi:hypothetical protein
MPSTHRDNISFGQTQRNPARLYMDPSSTVFSTFRIEANSRDMIRFGGGMLAPGEEARMYFLIADNGPTPSFYLTGDALVVPEPGTVALTVLGLAACWLGSRRRFRV